MCIKVFGNHKRKCHLYSIFFHVQEEEWHLGPVYMEVGDPR